MQHLALPDGDALFPGQARVRVGPHNPIDRVVPARRAGEQIRSRMGGALALGPLS